jgi:hypothetical protein
METEVPAVQSCLSVFALAVCLQCRDALRCGCMPHMHSGVSGNSYLLLVPVLLVSGRAVMTTSGGSQHTDCAQAGRLHLQDTTTAQTCAQTYKYIRSTALRRYAARSASLIKKESVQGDARQAGRQAAPAWWLAQSQVSPLQAQQVTSTHPRISQGSLNRLQDNQGTQR